MIIVKILGGLGNQLFQYASGRALAEKHHTELKLDISGFADDEKRAFELSHFNTKFSVATVEEITKLKAENTIERLKAKLIPYPFKKFYKQPFFHFDDRFFKLSGNLYLQGYFQSEKYFQPSKEVIQSEFQLLDVISPQLGQFAKELGKQNSVALHIRRGDYKDAESRRVHGILPLSYYREAINFFKAKLQGEPTFYIFSDDPEIAQNDLQLKESILISGSYTTSHLEDFYLMSKCRHNIIANSSFSWWAAWLNGHEEKLVVAPKKWFNEGPKDTDDLFPQSWLTL